MSIGIRSSGHLRWKFALARLLEDENEDAYSTKFITFKLFWFSAPESAFVDQVGQFLLHKLFNFGDSFFEP
jgi:hypothetical protein